MLALWHAHGAHCSLSTMHRFARHSIVYCLRLWVRGRTTRLLMFSENDIRCRGVDWNVEIEYTVYDWDNASCVRNRATTPVHVPLALRPNYSGQVFSFAGGLHDLAPSFTAPLSHPKEQEMSVKLAMASCSAFRRRGLSRCSSRILWLRPRV